MYFPLLAMINAAINVYPRKSKDKANCAIDRANERMPRRQVISLLSLKTVAVA